MVKNIYLVLFSFLLTACAVSPTAPISPLTEKQTEVPAIVTEIPPAAPAVSHIPILMYHYVRVVDKSKDLLGYNLSITPDEFAKQMQWLADNQYATVTPEDITNGTIPSHPIWLSFDDGYEDFYTTALPILSKYHFTATEAIIVGNIGKPSFMTTDEISGIVRDGMTLASHTFSHLDLTTLGATQLQHEIVESKKTLEDRFHTVVSTFVYPAGRYNDSVRTVVKNAGYSYALTTKEGVGDFSASRFDLKRIRIDNRVGFNTFVKEVSGAK